MSPKTPVLGTVQKSFAYFFFITLFVGCIPAGSLN
jgi:hypothetical protein